MVANVERHRDEGRRRMKLKENFKRYQSESQTLSSGSSLEK